MTDKGKAVLSARELAEEERQAGIRERVDRWLAAPPGSGPPFLTDPFYEPEPGYKPSSLWSSYPDYEHFAGRPESPPDEPIFPPNHIYYPDSPQETRPSPRRTFFFGRTEAGPSRRIPDAPDSPEYTPASPQGPRNHIPSPPDSPVYTPASPLPEPRVITNEVTEEHLVEYWGKVTRPNPPDLGPWYRLAGGFIQFRYGTPWHVVDRREREAAFARQEAQTRGEDVAQVPPPHQPGERLLHIREEPDSPPMARHVPPVQDPRVEEDEPIEPEEDEPIEPEEDEPMEPVDDEPIEPMDDDPIELSDDDEEDLRAWSDTSTVTEEPSMVPSTSRRPVWVRGIGARRT